MRSLRTLACFLPILIGLQSATQYIAHRFHYQMALGSPMLIWGEWWVYGPWQYVGWVQKAGRQFPHVFNASYMMVLAGGLLSALVWHWLIQAQRAEALPRPHASSQWATPQDIRKRGLL